MELNPLFIASGLGMIVVGFFFIIYWKVKTKINYLPFLLGALVWIICVALKFAWAMPINKSGYIKTKSSTSRGFVCNETSKSVSNSCSHY